MVHKVSPQRHEKGCDSLIFSLVTKAGSGDSFTHSSSTSNPLVSLLNTCFYLLQVVGESRCTFGISSSTISVCLCVRSSLTRYISTMLSTLLAIVYIVYYLYHKFKETDNTEKEDGPRICIVRPSLRWDPKPSFRRPQEYFTRSSTPDSILTSSSDDDAVGGEITIDESFMWSRHSGGGWTGWDTYGN